MAIHNRFALIEAAAERHAETRDNVPAHDAAAWISETLDYAFKRAVYRGLPKLDGADSCERVAEALAVWLAESAPRHFAEMTGTRYSIAKESPMA